jgi:hypothetical protein
MRFTILIQHICGGVVGVLAGAAAMSFRKGSRWHGVAGNVFFVAMLVMGLRVATGMVPPKPGVPTGMIFFLGFVALLAATGDLRMLVRGVYGTKRIVRHLWRMCFSFFIATGSFFLGQQQVFPKAWRGSVVWFVPALLPLAAMIYWLVRVRLKNAYKTNAAQPSDMGSVPPRDSGWVRSY